MGRLDGGVSDAVHASRGHGANLRSGVAFICPAVRAKGRERDACAGRGEACGAGTSGFFPRRCVGARSEGRAAFGGIRFAADWYTRRLCSCKRGIFVWQTDGRLRACGYRRSATGRAGGAPRGGHQPTTRSRLTRGKPGTGPAGGAVTVKPEKSRAGVAGSFALASISSNSRCAGASPSSLSCLNT